MARKFSHPTVQALEVGGSATVFNVAPAVLRRRVDTYAKRAKRRYQYDFGEVSHLVTRLPDPVTDTELPGAA